MRDFEEKEVKHIKRKNSSTSKSKEKSKHKHMYNECFIRYNFYAFGKSHDVINLGSYCTLCGKINEPIKHSKILEEKKESLFGLTIKKDEYDKKYTSYPLFEVDDFFQKYIEVPSDGKMTNEKR